MFCLGMISGSSGAIFAPLDSPPHQPAAPRFTLSAQQLSTSLLGSYLPRSPPLSLLLFPVLWKYSLLCWYPSDLVIAISFHCQCLFSGSQNHDALLSFILVYHHLQSHCEGVPFPFCSLIRCVSKRLKTYPVHRQ